ncbi:hypothetical protein PLESTM_001734100 [Pleodorina starrii]|nr:hypothetical protein PLESTM_001734100 [Pleodorina starrii]
MQRGGMFAAKPRGPAEAEEEAYDTFLEEWPRLRAHERRDYDQSLPDMRAPFAELLLVRCGTYAEHRARKEGRMPQLPLHVVADRVVQSAKISKGQALQWNSAGGGGRGR